MRPERVDLGVPGDTCRSDRSGSSHVILSNQEDEELQTVYRWMMARPVEVLFKSALSSTIDYVLDGARTGRFDLTSSEVDSDERRTVGVKLQYHIIEEFELSKRPPLDTVIAGVPVDLKATVGRNWTIPREGQCEICVLTQLDASKDEFRVLLMRTHRRWLNEGSNQDSKRTIRSEALGEYALGVVPWTKLRRNPLKDLTPAQLADVFNKNDGIRVRLTKMFCYLPEVIVPRSVILTVAAMADDPLRRARQAKTGLFVNHGLILLTGKWLADRELAELAGFSLGPGDWVAVRQETFGDNINEAVDVMTQEWRKLGYSRRLDIQFPLP